MAYDYHTTKYKVRVRRNKLLSSARECVKAAARASTVQQVWCARSLTVHMKVGCCQLLDQRWYLIPLTFCAIFLDLCLQSILREGHAGGHPRYVSLTVVSRHKWSHGGLSSDRREEEEKHSTSLSMCKRNIPGAHLFYRQLWEEGSFGQSFLKPNT